MSHLSAEESAFLKAKAKQIRIDILKMITKANSGHTGGSLSIADLLTLLYFKEMNVDPKAPHKADRDRLVLSKGHAAPAMYACLAEKGYFPMEELSHLRQAGHMLQGHPDMKHTPGVRHGTCQQNGQCFLACLCSPWRRRTGRRAGMGSSHVCSPLQAGPSYCLCG